jgi:hypothetical protein
VGQILLKLRMPRKYSWPVGICGQVLLKIRKHRKHSWPVGICGTDTLKNKKKPRKYQVPHIHTG